MGEPTHPTHPSRQPRPPSAVRAFWRRHPWLVDSMAALFCCLWVFDDGLGLRVPEPIDVWWLFVTLIVAAMMLIRRLRPWWVVLVAVAGGAVMANHFIGVALGCALYALAAYRSTRAAVLGSTLALGVLIPASLLIYPESSSDKAIAYVLITVGSVVTGANVRIRRRYLQALVDRTVQLAREKEREGELAAARERTRIAYDLHDIVAHSLTVMVRLADGAAAVANTDPEHARSASERAGRVGRDAMQDMRRLLGVLRDDPTGNDGPAMQELAAVVATFRTAGLPVTVCRQGPEPPSPSLRNAVFRTVQEAMTNALRYAERPESVLVDLDYRADPILVEVTDDGRGVGPAPSVGARQGLRALRERLALYGGTVEAGPRPGHGWTVRVTLPQSSEDADD